MKINKIHKKFYFGAVYFSLSYFFEESWLFNIPSICLDEIGYWFAAAYWNEQNWLSVMGNLSPYYSYNYSIILFLLIKIFQNVEILH